MPNLLSVIESPTQPNFSALYRRLGIKETRVESMRKAISQIKSQPPDFVVCEFFYGYSNNYAGVNISNLDVMLASAQKYAPEARVIVLVDKTECQYVAKLEDLFALHAVLTHPVSETALAAALV
jgi:DNA-binding NarL/FixJ family response regulator